MQLRTAADRDLVEINEIYNAEVETSIATLDTEPVSLAQRRKWLAEHQTRSRPAVVCEIDGMVAGWAALSSWSHRCGYARAAEVSVYVGRAHRRRGVGRALLGELIRRARAASVGVLLARVAGEPDSPSMALHRGLGFRHFAAMERVGEKLGQIVNVQLLDLHLD